MSKAGATQMALVALRLRQALFSVHVTASFSIGGVLFAHGLDLCKAAAQPGLPNTHGDLIPFQ